MTRNSSDCRWPKLTLFRWLMVVRGRASRDIARAIVIPFSRCKIVLALACPEQLGKEGDDAGWQKVILEKS